MEGLTYTNTINLKTTSFDKDHVGDRDSVAKSYIQLDKQLEDLTKKRRQSRSTVMLKPPVAVTHPQVVAAVRGGALQQIFIYRGTNYVDVSFINPDHALAFLKWASDAPLHVAGHQVSSIVSANLCFLLYFLSLSLPLSISFTSVCPAYRQSR